MAAREDFEIRTVPYRRELLAHCYQMLGSVHDAEDLVQETLLRAWRAFDRFDDRRASIRTWLHRIATNACLTALEGRGRRPLPSGLGGPSEDVYAPLVPAREVTWVEPVPDPAVVVADRSRLRLALIAAMQLLPPRQRAILIMREVLEWSAAEVAEALGTTPAAVNSGLQRARARMSEVGEDQVDEPAAHDQRALLDRYMTAFVNTDLAALGELLTEDVTLEMPPMAGWFAGREHFLGFMARAYAMRGTAWRMEHVGANGQPAAIAYANGEPHSIQLFTVKKQGLSRAVVFTDPAVLERFTTAAACR